MFVCGVAEAADDGGVAAVRDLYDAAGSFAGIWALGAGRKQFDEDEIALHGAVELSGRDKDVVNFIATRADIVCGSHEAESVAVQVKPTRYEVGARCGSLGEAPVVAISLDERSAYGETS